MFGTTLVTGSKYLLLEQVDSRNPVKGHCLYYGIARTLGNNTKVDGNLDPGQWKPENDPSIWVKIGVTISSIAGICTFLCFLRGVRKYFRKRNHPSSGTEEASASES